MPTLCADVVFFGNLFKRALLAGSRVLSQEGELLVCILERTLRTRVYFRNGFLYKIDGDLH